ncbi:hypothetical protein [Shimazuella kribbensis]|uniref:hypothetical protein n=1 Tax=Shimazuella kribbensis TaxID=139808 RepID=UPI00040F2592|nr:hypothetical protein [Shimazuella kribbensis]
MSNKMLLGSIIAFFVLLLLSGGFDRAGRMIGSLGCGVLAAVVFVFVYFTAFR